MANDTTESTDLRARPVLEPQSKAELPNTALPQPVPEPARPTLRHHLVPARPAHSPARRKTHPKSVRNWAMGSIMVVALGIGLTLMWMPEPVAVDLAVASVGPLVVSVNEDGRTRVTDRYLVSAPLAGTVMRLPLHPGDSVRQGDVVAQLVPLAVPLLDPRARAEGEARVAAARATVQQAATAVQRARAAADLAQHDAERQRTLLRGGAAAAQAVEQAEVAARMRAEELGSAEFGLRVATSEARLARAALLRLDQLGESRREQFEVRAPVAGRVLRVVQESEGVVQPGAPLLEIGDPRALEVIVDVLSTDAVEIRPGAPVLIERWGGDAVLHGHVRQVEPSAFTRISSLGVEEQRVNVIVDLDRAPAAGEGLGDGYRVEARIIIWQAPEVLQVPAGAVFRHDDGWAVYVVNNGRTQLRPILIGRRNDERAQVVRGLRSGEHVVIYPSDNVGDRVNVKERR